MPDNVKFSGPSMQERIHNRLKSSGEGANPDAMVKTGNSPNRTITHLHFSAQNETKESKKGERK